MRLSCSGSRKLSKILDPKCGSSSKKSIPPFARATSPIFATELPPPKMLERVLV